MGWLGGFLGEALSPAVFVYVARVRLGSGVKEVIKGDVTLLR